MSYRRGASARKRDAYILGPGRRGRRHAGLGAAREADGDANSASDEQEQNYDSETRAPTLSRKYQQAQSPRPKYRKGDHVVTFGLNRSYAWANVRIDLRRDANWRCAADRNGCRQKSADRVVREIAA